jgi:hypothetical protein
MTVRSSRAESAQKYLAEHKDDTAIALQLTRADVENEPHYRSDFHRGHRSIPTALVSKGSRRRWACVLSVAACLLDDFCLRRARRCATRRACARSRVPTASKNGCGAP